MTILTPTQDRRACEVLRLDAIERVTRQEDLLAEYEDRMTTLLLLDGDKQAGDSGLPLHIIDNAIAHEREALSLVLRQMKRVERVKRIARTTGRNIEADNQRRIDAVRELDIVEALQTLGVDLRKGSREWHGHCPLHDDSSPSFSVNQHHGLWCCFGCQEGGDLLTFLQMHFHLNFLEAVDYAELHLGAAEAA